MELRESTAVSIKLGPFVDKTDGSTPETGVTTTIKVSKNGGTMAARSSGTAIAHDADGYYTVALNSTDTNTRGTLRVTAADHTIHLAVWADYEVVSAEYYDEKYAGPVFLQSSVSLTSVLDTGASGTDDYYNGSILVIVEGPGAGQSRRIIDYVGASKTVTLDEQWITLPTSASKYRIFSNGSPNLDVLNGVESGLTVKGALRLIAAAAAGKISGASAGAGTVNVRNAVADSKTRITCTNDAYGNRTTVSVDAS